MTNINCPTIIQNKEIKNKYPIEIRRKKSSMYLAYVFLVESSCPKNIFMNFKKYMLQTKAICKATATA